LPTARSRGVARKTFGRGLDFGGVGFRGRGWIWEELDLGEGLDLGWLDLGVCIEFGHIFPQFRLF